MRLEIFACGLLLGVVDAGRVWVALGSLVLTLSLYKIEYNGALESSSGRRQRQSFAVMHVRMLSSVLPLGVYSAERSARDHHDGVSSSCPANSARRALTVLLSNLI